MTNANDPAFARTPFLAPGGEWTEGSGGMTKREYFAARAMQGLITDGEAKVIMELAQAHGIRPTLMLGIIAVSHADALIEALNTEIIKEKVELSKINGADESEPGRSV